FPVNESKAGLRGLPMCVPKVSRDQPVPSYQRVVEGLRADTRPILLLWGEEDLVLTLASGERLASSIGRRIDHVIPSAGHGLQEARGPLVGRLIADWLVAGP